jgi:hypothetical protein
MPPDKAPGPDGFNGLFLKKCWTIVKDDFLALCEEFYSGSANLEGLNTSYITLIPKTNSPETVTDYRPISLMNISPKIFRKILAERLQRKIISLIHRNQYGFIKTRSIQDCLAWSFEYIHQCQQSKKEAIILKLDFEKAFDTVEHQTILAMLTHLGFPERWIFWVTNCRMDLPGPTTLVGNRTDYSVGPWDYSACATRHLMAWGTRTSVEKYSDRKLYMSCTM